MSGDLIFDISMGVLVLSVALAWGSIDRLRRRVARLEARERDRKLMGR